MIADVVIERCIDQAVPAWIVKGIIDIESNSKPFAVNVNYPKKNKISYVPQHNNIGGAMQQANVYINKGMTVSVGLMQVSSQNFRTLGLTLKSAFDSCTNIRAGSKIFKEAYKITNAKYKDKDIALNRALSLYNSGDEVIGLPYALRFRNATGSSKVNNIALAKLVNKPTAVGQKKVVLKVTPPTGLDFNRGVTAANNTVNHFNNLQKIQIQEARFKQAYFKDLERQRLLGITENPYSMETQIMIPKRPVVADKKPTKTDIANETIPKTLKERVLKKAEDLSVEGATIKVSPEEAEEMGAFEDNAISDNEK